MNLWWRSRSGGPWHRETVKPERKRHRGPGRRHTRPKPMTACGLRVTLDHSELEIRPLPVGGQVCELCKIPKGIMLPMGKRPGATD